MKRTFDKSSLFQFLFLFLISILYNTTNAQTFNGDITLTTQAQVDSFNYTRIFGSLTIDDSPDGDITHLNGLSELTDISVQLDIHNNPALESLQGLSSLSYSNFIDIRNNGIKDIGLPSLQSTTGFFLLNNNSLKNLDGLEGFSTTSDIRILENDSLLNIDALSNLSSASVVISGNDMLTNINGLSGMKGFIVLNGHLDRVSIENNKSLKNIDSLINVTSVSFLHIVNNDSLLNLDGLSNARGENGDALIVTDNPLLSDFCGLFNYFLIPKNIDVIISGNAVNPTPEEIRTGSCAPPVPEGQQSFISVLLGDNEIPPVQTEGSGGGIFILNATHDSLHFWIRICELDCPLNAAGFFIGKAGSFGPNVRSLTNEFQPDTMGSYFAHGVWTSSDAQPLTPSIVNNLFAGNIYINIYSTGHTTGEIRGQITDNVPVELFANLDGGQETPPVMTMGSGEGHFTLSGDGDSLEYSIMFGNLSGPVAASHFHKAAFGVPGPVVRGFTTVGDSMAEGVWTNMDAQPLTPSLVADLLGCFIYANIHTQQHPGGEIRGQLYKTESMMKQYMTIWAAENDADPNQNSKLNFYSLAEGKQFLNREGDITGYTGEKKIVDLTIDIGGNIYFLNNTWTSMIYKIKASAIDLDESTSLYAKQIGRTRTFPNEKLVWLSHIQFIRGKLYGLDNKSNKLYEINQYNAYVKEIADLSTLDKMAAGFALGADGNVYLLKTLDQSRSEIWKFDSFPGNSLSLVTGISSLDKLESFASHPNGKLYASDKSSLYGIDLNERTVGILEDHQVNISAVDFDAYNEKTAEAVATVNFTDISAVTSVEGFTGMPTQYSLSQNYPNPFNPNTIIKYSLPEAAFVRLKVYNSLGELVKTLVSETKNAGYYEISFDASSLSSGMYIYKIEAGSFISSNKMILLK